MLKSLLLILLLSFVLTVGCSNDDDNNITPPPSTGEVLLATISGDSVGTSSGFSSNTASITSQMLNFTDRDSVRISFYYSSGVSNTVVPLTIYCLNKSTADSILYYNYLPTGQDDQFIDTTFSSPKVNKFFQYQIAVSSGGFSYFKFRDLKIYKK